LIGEDSLHGASNHWENQGHFFSAAARAMQRILVEHARRKGCVKRGGGRRRLDWHASAVVGEEPDERVLALDELLERLAKSDSTKAELIRLRYFAGLTVEQAAQVLGVSRATAERHWAFARAWLYSRLSAE
jgi:RNA polymerase sigma factor (TIGR02999 family)